MHTKFLHHKRRTMLLAVALVPIMGHARQETMKEIQTPGGSVSLTSTAVEPVPQQVLPVTGARLVAIRALEQGALQFLEAYRPGSNRFLKDYDAAFRAWQNDQGRQFSDETVIERLGAHLGNLMVADFDMEWVEVTDEVGHCQASCRI